jgi:hypothetical protein
LTFAPKLKLMRGVLLGFLGFGAVAVNFTFVAMLFFSNSLRCFNGIICRLNAIHIIGPIACAKIWHKALPSPRIASKASVSYSGGGKRFP